MYTLDWTDTQFTSKWTGSDIVKENIHCTKIKFSIKGFCRVKVTEEILNGKLHCFFCSEINQGTIENN